MRVIGWWIVVLCLCLPLTARAADPDMVKLRAEAFETWTKWIKSRDVERRRSAAESLGGYDEEPGSAGMLAGVLNDRDDLVRLNAASSLWKLADSKVDIRIAESALRAALEDRVPAVRVKAAGALERMGVPPAELVAARESVLREGDWFDVALAARDLIGSVDAAPLAEPLLWSMRNAPVKLDSDQFDAGDVLMPLAKTGDRAVIDALMPALRDPDLRKVQLLEALGTFEPPPDGWVDALLAATREPDPDAREIATDLLRAHLRRPGKRDWIARTLHLLRDPDDGVVASGCNLLADAGGDAHPAVDELIALLAEERDPGLRRVAIRALAAAGDVAEAYDRTIKASIAERARPVIAAIARNASEEDDTRRVAEDALKSLAQGSATGTRAIPVATSAGDADALQRLRARGVELTEDTFWRALGDRDVQTLDDLLAAGFSPKSLASAEMPPLHMLVMTGCDYQQPTAAETQRMVAALIRHGADVNGRDKAGDNTVLHRASSCDGKLVKALLAAGADMNVSNATGMTAFGMFVAVSNLDAANAMLDAGFRFSAKEAASSGEWLKAEADPAKRKLLQRAGAGAMNIER